MELIPQLPVQRSERFSRKERASTIAPNAGKSKSKISSQWIEQFIRLCGLLKAPNPGAEMHRKILTEMLSKLKNHRVFESDWM